MYLLYSDKDSTTPINISPAPELKIKFGDGEERTIPRNSNNITVNGNVITYKYTVQSGDNGVLAVSSYTGTMYDKAGNALVLTTRVLGGNTITADTINYIGIETFSSNFRLHSPFQKTIQHLP